jgi:hypothetical protein
MSCRSPLQGRISLSARFSLDGRWLVTSAFREPPGIWDLRADDPAALGITLPGHEYPLVLIEISRDGRWLVTADTDVEDLQCPRQTCRIWDLHARDPAASAAVLPAARPDRIMITPDNRWVITAGAVGGRLWPLGVPALLELVPSAAGRALTADECALTYRRRNPDKRSSSLPPPFIGGPQQNKGRQFPHCRRGLKKLDARVRARDVRKFDGLRNCRETRFRNGSFETRNFARAPTLFSQFCHHACGLALLRFGVGDLCYLWPVWLPKLSFARVTSSSISPCPPASTA